MQEVKAPYGGLITEVGLRRMQWWGLATVTVWVLTLVIWGILWPDPYSKAWWLVVQLFAVGRTVCAYEGVRLGFSNFFLFMQGGTQDIAMFMLVFPLFVRFYERASHVRGIDRFLGGLARAAERHQGRMQGYGAVGLFLFVFFPVSGTGTLVGSIVGYLLGLRMRLVIPVVITAHFSSLVLLLAFFDWLQPVLESLNEGFAQYFAWILLASMVFLGWVYTRSQTKSSAAIKPSSTPPPALVEAEVGVEAGE